MTKVNFFCCPAIIAIFFAVIYNEADAQERGRDQRWSIQSLAVTTISPQITGMPPLTRKIGNRKLAMETASPVTTISGQRLESTGYSTDLLKELVLTVPGTHVNVGRESTINLRGLGTARTLVLVDGKRLDPVYGQSVTYDVNGLPTSAVERIEVLKDGASAVYGSDAVSGVVNFITRSEMQPRITSGNVYDPYYDYPTFNFSGVQNKGYDSWTNNIKTVFSTTPGATTIPDATYGKGGSLQVNLRVVDDFRVQDLKFLDREGNLRQWTSYEIYPEYYRYGETNYYDCSGKTLHQSSSFTDKNGYDYSLFQRAYQNNQPAAEYRDIWPADNGNRLRLNLWPQQTSNDAFRGYWSKYNFDMPAGACKSNSSTSCERNIFYTGFSLVFEDFGNGEKLKMPGGFVNYTRMFSENLGATGHLSYNSAERGMIDYSKLSFLAGISYTPFQSANCDDGFIVTTQVLLGILNQGQKYNNTKFSDTYFTGMVGVTEAFKLSDNVAVRVAEHYTPTFADGNTAHNFTLGLGVRFTF